MTTELEALRQHNHKALQELAAAGVAVDPNNFILLRLDALFASVEPWQAEKANLMYEQAVAGLFSPENVQAAKLEAARRKLQAQ
jgi:hypothetical protein